MNLIVKKILACIFGCLFFCLAANANTKNLDKKLIEAEIVHAQCTAGPSAGENFVIYRQTLFGDETKLNITREACLDLINELKNCTNFIINAQIDEQGQISKILESGYRDGMRICL